MKIKICIYLLKKSWFIFQINFVVILTYAALLKKLKRVKCVACNMIGGWSRLLSTGRRSPESLIWRFQIESKPPFQKLQKFIYPVNALSQ